MNDDAAQVVTIEKTMTLSAGEFAKSIVAFAGHDVVLSDGHVTLVVGADGGRAQIAFKELPGRRLGGLLELPQARVTIRLTKVAADQMQAFLNRFDIAFQRGGG